MPCDLRNALDNKPFGEVKYDDIYSVSSLETRTEEVITPTVEEISPESVAEDVTPTVFLKEEIKIPEITSPTELYPKKTEQKRKPIQHAKLPVIKRRSRKNTDKIRKTVILAIMTLLFFVMFLTSVFLRMSNKEDKMTTVAANINADVINSYYGGALYGT